MHLKNIREASKLSESTQGGKRAFREHSESIPSTQRALRELSEHSESIQLGQKASKEHSESAQRTQSALREHPKRPERTPRALRERSANSESTLARIQPSQGFNPRKDSTLARNIRMARKFSESTQGDQRTLREHSVNNQRVCREIHHHQFLTKKEDSRVGFSGRVILDVVCDLMTTFHRCWLCFGSILTPFWLEINTWAGKFRALWSSRGGLGRSMAFILVAKVGSEAEMWKSWKMMILAMDWLRFGGSPGAPCGAKGMPGSCNVARLWFVGCSQCPLWPRPLEMDGQDPQV